MAVPAPPRVSILLPCRDAAPFLDDCIASLAAQTEPGFEVLALDDGSRDRTGARLAAWAEADARVRVFPSCGRGIVAALERLRREARAPFIARMDADDVARPERLATQLALLRAQPDIAACGTGIRYFPRALVRSGYRRYESWINGLATWSDVARDLFVECPIAHPTLMIRRDALRSVGGYRELEGPEDYDLVLRLAAAGRRLANVPRILLEWRLGEHRLSVASPRYAPAAFRRLKVDWLRRGFVPPDRPVVVWGAGKVGKAFAREWNRQCRPARGAGAAGDSAENAGPYPAEAPRGRVWPAPVAAFVDLDPRKIGQTIHDAPVIAPDQLGGLEGGGARPYVLIAVGSPGAREEIRGALDSVGFRELADFRAVA